MDRPAPILGLHHISIVSAAADRTIAFYHQILGLELAVRGVDPASGQEQLFWTAPNSGELVLACQIDPTAAPGMPGLGGTHHYALQVADYDGLLRWKRRLVDAGLAVDGPLDRHYFVSIYFNDPDGTIIEIATAGPGWTRDEPAAAIGTTQLQPPAEMVVRNRDEARIAATTWPTPVAEIDAAMALRGFHHITAIGGDIERSHAFLHGTLGLRRVKMTFNFDDPTSAHWYWGAHDGRPGTIITYFERDPARTRRVRHGAGQTTRYAFTVPAEALEDWRAAIAFAGLPVSEIAQGLLFRSFATCDPDGHEVELATPPVL